MIALSIIDLLYFDPAFKRSQNKRANATSAPPVRPQQVLVLHIQASRGLLVPAAPRGTTEI